MKNVKTFVLLVSILKEREEGRKERDGGKSKKERREKDKCALSMAMWVDRGARSHCWSQTGRCHGVNQAPRWELQVACTDATSQTFLAPDFCCY